ncbi:MAG: ThuA domain-containing protein [Spirochaetaceae bacterium]|jgi:type 1 glutamine amidotransferase|nr:ThuA domain-containing protein [Spirochaetaceae bacterium]
MKVLVFCDDVWHPSSVVKEGLSFLESKGYIFHWIEDTREWSPSNLFSYSIVILSKANNISSQMENSWMTEEIEELFKKYVDRGGNLLVLHSGIAGYGQNVKLRSLMGGIFSFHPDQCLVNMIPASDHVLTRGSDTFSIKDEHYFVIIEDDNIDIFLTTESEHGTQPGGWKRYEGEGKVAVLTPGHNLEVWLNSSFQKILENVFRWMNG